MLVLSIIFLLLANAFDNRRDSSILYSRITILVLTNTLIITYLNTNINFIYDGLVLFGGLLCIKTYTFIFIMFIILLTILIIGINTFLPGEMIKRKIINIDNFGLTFYINKMSDQYRIIEYPLIVLFCLTGAIFLMSSYDIVSIFLALELQSYGLYLISSIYRNSESSISAGLTYFLLGSLSSCIILLGIALLYINTGSTNLENIFILNSISNAYSSNIIYNDVYTNDLWVYKYIYMQYTFIQLPLSIISVGLLFKIAAAPFHFWSPDVYDAIPTIVTTFVAIIAKISLLILLFELILYTENSVLSLSWSNNLILSSILSLFIGSVLGLVQYRIKRLYAYSTISHVGFILLALAINSLDSTRAFFFYLMQYSLSNLNAFIILITIGYSLYNYIYINEKFKNNSYSPIYLISQLKGYFYINPMLSISLAITLFSFVGIPPLIGFFGKQMVLTAAIDNGYIFSAFIAIITSVISAVYYLVLIKEIFFEKENYKPNNLMLNNLLKKNYVIPIKDLPAHNQLSKINTITYIPDNESIKQVCIGTSNLFSSYLSLSVSILTLLIVTFLWFSQDLQRLIYILPLYL